MKAPAASLGIVIPAIAIGADGASATEFYIGEPLTRNGLQIAPAYLLGVEMEPMPKHSGMGADAVHLEADIHALGDETHGFPEDAWIPYLTISYTIEKVGSSFGKSAAAAPDDRQGRPALCQRYRDGRAARVPVVLFLGATVKGRLRSTCGRRDRRARMVEAIQCRLDLYLPQ